MNELFNQLTLLKKELQNETSTKKKKEILKQYNSDNVKKILYYTYSSFIHFNVTSKQIKKYYENKYKYIPKLKQYNDIFELLDNLQYKKISGHQSLEIVCDYINKYKEYKEIILNVIDKDLQIRMNVKLINSVFPRLIPTFQVALAELYDKHQKKVKEGEWYISRKMDGIRCLCIIHNNNISFYSRLGKEIFTLENIKKEIKKYIVPKIKESIVLDGELCIIDENGNEQFKDIMKHFRKKNSQIQNPKYKVFDCINYNDFIFGESKDLLLERLSKLNKYIDNRLNTIEVLEQKLMEDSTFDIEWKKSNEHQWEGLILRKNTIYKGKRSNDMLKVKKFNDDEFVVLKINNGPYRIIDKIEKKEKIINTLTSVEIEYKNNIVHVGSGFTLNEREYYKNNPEEIIGHKIKVQWFEEIKTGNKYSLRFPTYKGNYGKERIL